MAKNIVLIGCGNIGSRHLQGLAKLQEECSIQVVDTDPSSIEMGKLRLREILGQGSTNPQVTWLDDVDKVMGDPDLTIVATDAANRIGILTGLINRGHSRFLVEKMVCQSTGEYEQLLRMIDEHKVKAWVNCSRRYTDFYGIVASVLHQHDTPMIFNVRGGDLGLGCNAIHFIDLFSWFSGDSESLELDGTYVLPELLVNPRGKDLIEFAGTIVGKNRRNDLLTVSFLPASDAGISLNILCGNTEIFVNEDADKADMFERKKDACPREFPFKVPFASEITTHIARDIFSRDSCLLPGVEDSFAAHKELFRVFNSVIEKRTNRKTELCPIT